MHSNQYFLRSVKSNMNDNLIALVENNSLTQTHLQAQSADAIPVSSASILPTTTSQVFSTPLSSSTSVHQSLLQNTQPPTITTSLFYTFIIIYFCTSIFIAKYSTTYYNNSKFSTTPI